ncbi:M20 aminoacylase family protein [Bordetella holmesii]|uniref:Amidohydrolase n=2 Tax=Bordetella holmesii TaxID=35814 RepID=A0A158M4P9_9BORD|nr:M20 aminoacylase family protein [Bordetella holmesii]AHV91542.1 amidohydrolase family protein [Bordetella holmesii ATCC 51541]AIT26037.1 amidohydrolase family protein [Bordetella holmesii 44057]EWM42794.1 amidohydrolase family protein [Bordetella holmesii 41130]EWM46608.1 amidohydrolase family protein [Bordetella holmesii 35009]EWM50772.1 amidohydrolase family protein [Bordetella holmesii 70147]
MKTIDEIQRAHGDLTALRRDIHAHPELAFQETRTSTLVAERLRALGLEVHTGLGKTGVVGVLRAGSSKRSVGLRADMDALPMPEHNRFEHKSTIAGRMHGCGHDGHTAILLGAAQYLAAHPDFDGTVNFIFQPAEEGGNAGARAMMEDGLFERFPCDAVFGLHNMPGMPVNQFGFRTGPTMASSNRWDIVIKGLGGHAAQPHVAVDPIVIASEMVQALQTVISRGRNPLDPAVLSITQIHAGDAYNVIPGEAVLRGTVRTYTLEALDKIEADMRRIATTLPQVYGGSGELDFVRAYPPLVNWENETAFATRVAQDVFGAENVNPQVPQFMGAEDFSFFLEKVPGCYLFLGNGDGDHRLESYHGMGPCQLHNPNYDFNDALLPVGATYWVKLVQAFLPIA